MNYQMFTTDISNFMLRVACIDEIYDINSYDDVANEITNVLEQEYIRFCRLSGRREPSIPLMITDIEGNMFFQTFLTNMQAYFSDSRDREYFGIADRSMALINTVLSKIKDKYTGFNYGLSIDRNKVICNMSFDARPVLARIAGQRRNAELLRQGILRDPAVRLVTENKSFISVTTRDSYVKSVTITPDTIVYTAISNTQISMYSFLEMLIILGDEGRYRVKDLITGDIA